MLETDPLMLLVGEATPVDREPWTGPTAARLAGLLGLDSLHRPWILRANLHGEPPRDWHPRLALRAATMLLLYAEDRGASLVLACGGRVADAFDARFVPPCFVWPGYYGPVSFAWIPHPSGRNVYYQDPENRRRVGAFLRGMVRLHGPARQEGSHAA